MLWKKAQGGGEVTPQLILFPDLTSPRTQPLRHKDLPLLLRQFKDSIKVCSMFSTFKHHLRNERLLCKKLKQTKISDLGNYPFMEINITAATGVFSTDQSCRQEKYSRCGFSILLTKRKTGMSFYKHSPQSIFLFS